MQPDSHIPPIFRDPQLQEQFEREGYVIVPLLSENEIQKLISLFYEFHTDLPGNSFGASSMLGDKNLKLQIRDALLPLFQPHFDKLFSDYTYFGSSFLYKTPGKNSDLAPHQDWTIVDEKKYVAINIWTPLVDTDEHNGTLYVVPRTQSQKMFTLRAPTIPFFFQQYFDSVIRCSVPTNAKAGTAVILNQSLIHYSSPNYSDKIRIAITSGIKSKGAPMLFHFKNASGEIERYEMPEDFLLDFGDFLSDIYQAPKNGKRSGTLQWKPSSISETTFLRQYGLEKETLYQRISRVLKKAF